MLGSGEWAIAIKRELLQTGATLRAGSVTPLREVNAEELNKEAGNPVLDLAYLIIAAFQGRKSSTSAQPVNKKTWGQPFTINATHLHLNYLDDSLRALYDKAKCIFWANEEQYLKG